MQWDAGPNAGFTDAVRPWLPLDTGYSAHNVEILRGDPRSLVNLYRELIDLRRNHHALSVGGFRLLVSNASTLIYERTMGEDRLVVALNFTDMPQALPTNFGEAFLLLTTRLDRKGTLEEVVLRPNEGLIVRGA
jgi:alpha-glucosidase